MGAWRVYHWRTLCFPPLYTHRALCWEELGKTLVQRHFQHPRGSSESLFPGKQSLAHSREEPQFHHQWLIPPLPEGCEHPGLPPSFSPREQPCLHCPQLLLQGNLSVWVCPSPEHTCSFAAPPVLRCSPHCWATKRWGRTLPPPTLAFLSAPQKSPLQGTDSAPRVVSPTG